MHCYRALSGRRANQTDARQGTGSAAVTSRTMKGAQAAGVLAQALRDGEEQFAGAVAQRAHQEGRIAQVPGVRLVRHLVPA